MSYHICIKNNAAVTFSEVLENKYMPENVVIADGKEKDEVIEAYSKFYIPLQSSRGVSISKDEEEYDIQLNTGASTADYYLATRIALALSVLNNTEISPEFDESLSTSDFEEQYDKKWAKESESMNLSTLVHFVNQDGATMQLSGCKRPFYFGQKMLFQLSSQELTEEEIAKNIVEQIIRLQFIEDVHEDIEVPTLMEADFPEGVKTFIVVAANFRLLLTKSDYIILRDDEDIHRVASEDFIAAIKKKDILQRVDEEQYVMQPLNDSDYNALITQFSQTETPKKEPKKRKSKWKFWK